MKIIEILQSLDNSWSREEVLSKIKKGVPTDNIVNEFFNKNQHKIEKLNIHLKLENENLLTQIEELSRCEAKLINKIKESSDINLKVSLNNNNKTKTFTKKRKLLSNELGMFMVKWSNKFVYIALITISAVALSKQAWT